MEQKEARINVPYDYKHVHIIIYFKQKDMNSMELWYAEKSTTC